MVLPIGDQAAQHVGPPEEWAVGRARAAEHDVIAAARARVPAVEHELLGHEPRVVRVLVETLGDRAHLVPARRGLHVDFDDAGIGRHLDHTQARIARRLVAFEVNRQVELRARVLDGREQVEVVLELGDGRHEHAQPPVARLDRDRRARMGARRRELRRRPLAPRLALLAAQERLALRERVRQRLVLDERIAFNDMRILRRRQKPQRRQRQTKTERRIARHDEQLARARAPELGAPPLRGRGRGVPALHGQHVADGLVQASFEDAREPRARHGIFEAIGGRIEILGQLAFLPDEVPRILVGRHGRDGIELET